MLYIVNMSMKLLIAFAKLHVTRFTTVHLRKHRHIIVMLRCIGKSMSA